MEQWVFQYMTPQPQPLPPDPPVPPIPTSFTLGGITEEVARGVRDGLLTVASITDVTLTRVTAVTEEIPV